MRMETRLQILPDERFSALRAGFDERLSGLGGLLSPANFSSFLDAVMRDVLHSGFARAAAHEGSVWLLDEKHEHLAIAHNTGPNAARLIGDFKQPLNTGLISLVVASEQPLCENRMRENALQDKSLDQKLGLVTCAMLATPFSFGCRMRGVISCVQLTRAELNEPEPAGFSLDHLRALQFTAATLSRLIDQRLLMLAIGREK